MLYATLSVHLQASKHVDMSDLLQDVEGHVFVLLSGLVVLLHSFRCDVLSSVPAAAQTTQMSLQQVFALLSGTQVSHLSNNYLCTTLNIHTIDMPDSGYKWPAQDVSHV